MQITSGQVLRAINLCQVDLAQPFDSRKLEQDAGFLQRPSPERRRGVWVAVARGAHAPAVVRVGVQGPGHAVPASGDGSAAHAFLLPPAVLFFPASAREGRGMDGRGDGKALWSRWAACGSVSFKPTSGHPSPLW